MLLDIFSAQWKIRRYRGGGKDIANALEPFARACQCVDEDGALLQNLPIDKVKRLCAYGGLKYPTSDL